MCQVVAVQSIKMERMAQVGSKIIPNKAAASKAAKTLSSGKAGNKAKSIAAKTLAKRSVAVRTVKAAPKTGKVSSSNVKRAVKSVLSSRRKK